MTMLHFESFEKYASGTTGWGDFSTDNADAPYTIFTSGTGPNMDASADRFGAKQALNIDTARYFAFPFAAVAGATSVVIAGMCFNITTHNDSTDRTLLSATPANNSVVYHFRVSAIGGALYVFDATGAVAASVQNAFGVGVWHTLEVKCTMANSGSITVKLDGVTLVNAVTGDFLNTSTTLGYLRVLQDLTAFVDWVYVLDDQGSSLNNFIGDFRVESVVPDADGTTAAWTASAGSNFQCIDDALGGYNDDTDYISSATNDQDNLASHSAVSLTGVAAIPFVNLTVMSRDDGSNNVALLMYNSGTTVASATFTTATTYNWRNFTSVDIPGGTGWANAAAINGAEFGVRAKT